MSDTPRLTDEKEKLVPWITLGVLVMLLIWGYADTLASFVRAWDRPEYSHGWLIPLFAVVFLWVRQEEIKKVPLVDRWYGFGLLVFGLLMRLSSTHFIFVPVDNYSFIVCLMGIVMLVGGWRMIRWAGPAVLFLAFMIPLPMLLSRGLLGELKLVATAGSTYMLQTLGIDVYRESTQITLGDHKLNVVEACAGMRMATILLAMAVAVVLVARRSWWENIVIVVSAIPIAIAANVIRITITGLFYLWFPAFSQEDQEAVHNWMGYMMAPVALGLLYVELVVLANLFIEPRATKPMALGRQGRPSPMV